MARFPEAVERMFGNVFVCRRCKTKIRAQILKILQKKISCKKCGGRNFRPIKKK